MRRCRPVTRIVDCGSNCLAVFCRVLSFFPLLVHRFYCTFIHAFVTMYFTRSKLNEMKSCLVVELHQLTVNMFL